MTILRTLDSDPLTTCWYKVYDNSVIDKGEKMTAMRVSGFPKSPACMTRRKVLGRIGEKKTTDFSQMSRVP